MFTDINTVVVLENYIMPAAGARRCRDRYCLSSLLETCHAVFDLLEKIQTEKNSIMKSNANNSNSIHKSK